MDATETKKRRRLCKRCNTMHYNFEPCNEGIEPDIDLIPECPKWEQGNGLTPVESLMRRIEKLEETVNLLIIKES